MTDCPGCPHWAPPLSLSQKSVCLQKMSLIAFRLFCCPFVILLSLFSVFARCLMLYSSRHRISANAVLNKHLSARLLLDDDSLRQAWHEFLVLQANQSAVARRDHPVDGRLLNALHKCASPFHGPSPSLGANDDANDGDGMLRHSCASAATLAPQWVEIYAQIGHLTQFCTEAEGQNSATALLTAANNWMTKTTPLDLREMAEEFRNKCSVRSMPSSLDINHFPLTLAQMFTSIGARVDTVFVPWHGAGGNLSQWTRKMVDKVRTVRSHETRWKLLLIAPGLHDIPYGHSSAELAQDVLHAVQLIHHGLPHRTFLLILRQSSLTFWRSVATSVVFCSKMLTALWKLDSVDDDERAWDLLEAHLRAVYGDDEEFHVQMVDLMERARPVITAKNFADLSPLSSDCVHLSLRGISMLHLQLWNWLVQPRLRHSQPFVPLLRPPLCPRPHCPFLATSRNIVTCPRLPPMAASSRFSNALSLRLLSVQLSPRNVLVLLLLGFMLLLILGTFVTAAAICAASASACRTRRRRHRRRFTEATSAAERDDWRWIYD